MIGLLTEHCHLREHLLKVELVDSPEYGRGNQASEAASYSL